MFMVGAHLRAPIFRTSTNPNHRCMKRPASSSTGLNVVDLPW
jgi:hypothetical protein